MDKEVYAISSKLFSLLLWCSISLSCAKLHAQTYNFKSLGVNEGLSQASALCLHQDHLNRIWIGTREGLNCFDGERLQIFQPNEKEASLLDYWIRDIQQHGNQLWILSKTGLNCLDLITMSFRSFPMEDISSFAFFQGEILAGLQTGGLLRLDILENKFVKLDLPLKVKGISVLYAEDTKLYIGTEYQGIFLLSENYDFSTVDSTISRVKNIFVDSHNRVWLGTEFEGIFVLNEEFRQLYHFHEDSESLQLSNNTIRDITQDISGLIWVGTFEGINIINFDQQTVSYIQNDPNNPRGLRHPSVYDLLIDREGTIWVGTYFGGVNYTSSLRKSYTYFDLEKPNLSPSSKIIGSMVEGENGDIWIATEGGGLNRLEVNTQKFTHYPTELTGDNIRTLLLDETSKLLFMGSHYGGLSVLDIESETISTIGTVMNSEKKPRVINTLLKWHDKILIGSRSGLLQYDQLTGKISNFTLGIEQLAVNESIYCLYNDSEGQLWIGTETKGLICYNNISKKIRRYMATGDKSNQLKSNSIYDILEDHDGNIWIATLGGGLSKYRKDQDDLVTYTKQKNNIPSDFIFGLQESKDGNSLWVSTRKGLFRFDHRHSTLINYTTNNGFPLNELNQGGLLLTSDQKLFIGGIEGLIAIDEDELISQQENKSIIFSELSVNGEKVSCIESPSIIKTDISEAHQINLKDSHSFFSISFAAADFLGAVSKYEYKLEGFNEDWITNDIASANYTNIESGKYTFRVRAKSAFTNSTVAEKSIIIIVHPAFYQTWWAYLLYLVFGIGLIILGLYTYWSRTRLSLELKEKKNFQRLQEQKVEFFNNVSHEFKTPVTLILGAIEPILSHKTLTQQVLKNLKITYKNALRLKFLSKELIDFRKLELDSQKLNIQKINLDKYLNQILEAFENRAHQEKVLLQYEPPQNRVNLYVDRYQLDKVFYNLLSNAFNILEGKKGRIGVTISENNSYVNILVSDNGMGIPIESQEKIFERYYQIENKSGNTSQGSGIGLALSRTIVEAHHGKLELVSSTEKGTVFRVSLPKGKASFSSDEFSHQIVSSQEQTPQPNSYFPSSEPNSHPLSSTPPGNNKNLTILIVEDNPDLLALLSDLLGGTYKIITATDGDEGLEIAKKESPDLIISDIMMKRISGITLCKELKQDLLTSHIPIVMLTAKDTLDSKLEGIEVGADDYIVKPFNSIYLKSRIANIFTNRKRLQRQILNKTIEGKSLTTSVQALVESPIDREFMNMVNDILSQNISNEQFDVNTFAHKMNIGRTIFFRKIKGLTGQTPNEVILSFRLNKAKELLSHESSKTIAEVAYEVGFSSPKYFSKCFKKKFGLLPSKWIAKQRVD